MSDPVPNALAIVVRPLWREVAATFGLPDGILGVALSPTPSRSNHIYFAEFVGPSYPCDDLARSDITSGHYVLPHDSVLSAALFLDVLETEGDLPAGQLTGAVIRFCNREDISRPLSELFGGALPDPVLLLRAWLQRPHSILYYIPKVQDEPDSWKILLRSSRFVACLLRTSMVIVGVAECVNAAAIQPLLDCLPTLFPDHEARLTEIVAEGTRLKERCREDHRNTLIEVDYEQPANRRLPEVLFTAKRPAGADVLLVKIKCDQKLEFTGDTGKGLIDAPAGVQRSRQTLAFFMMAKAINPEGHVADAAAYEFMFPDQHARLSSELTPAELKRVRDAVGSRVETAERHLRQIIDPTGTTKFFERKQERAWCFIPRVTLSERFKEALKLAVERHRNNEVKPFIVRLVRACEAGASECRTSTQERFLLMKTKYDYGVSEIGRTE